MKKLRILTLILALALTAVPALAAGGYADVPEDSWAIDDIETVSELGLMQGVGGVSLWRLGELPEGIPETLK